MSLANLTPTIQAFLSAVRAGDSVALHGTLEDGAVLADDGREYRGDDITSWLEDLKARRINNLRLIDETKHGGDPVITILTDECGIDGDSVEIQRDWLFKAIADRIVAVRLERRQLPAVPPAVAAYVRAINHLDLEGLLATFFDDAINSLWNGLSLRTPTTRSLREAPESSGIVNSPPSLVFSIHVREFSSPMTGIEPSFVCRFNSSHGFAFSSAVPASDSMK